MNLGDGGGLDWIDLAEVVRLCTWLLLSTHFARSMVLQRARSLGRVCSDQSVLSCCR
jgi:hypothetical protein